MFSFFKRRDHEPTLDQLRYLHATLGKGPDSPMIKQMKQDLADSIHAMNLKYEAYVAELAAKHA